MPRKPKDEGLPKSHDDYAALFQKALMRDATEHDGEDLIGYAVKKARESDTVLCRVLNKILPDLSQHTRLSEMLF